MSGLPTNFFFDEMKLPQIAKQYISMFEINQDFAIIQNPSGIFDLRHNQFITKENLKLFIPDCKDWLKDPQRRIHQGIIFDPGLPKITSENDYNIFNGWKHWKNLSLNGTLPGERPEAYQALLDHLIPDRMTQNRFDQWIAFPFQYPGQKSSTFWLITSLFQGTGKSILGKMILRLHEPYSRPIERSELFGTFNEGMAYRTFFLIHEAAHFKKTQRIEEFDQLKTFITESVFILNRKFQPSLLLKNCFHLLGLSNHPDALHLDDFERRGEVVHSKAKEIPQKTAQNFVDLYENHLDLLVQYFAHLDLKNYNPNQRAILSSSKELTVFFSRSDIENKVVELKEDPDSVLGLYWGERMMPVPPNRNFFLTPELAEILAPGEYLSETLLSKILYTFGFTQTRISLGTIEGRQVNGRLWQIRYREEVFTADQIRQNFRENPWTEKEDKNLPF